MNRNKKKGIARLKITFPLPTFGTVYLFGKGLKKKRATVTADGSVRLRVVTKGGVRKQLRKRGKRKVRVKVKYAPSGIAASTKSRTIKLVKKKRKRKSR